MAALLQRSSIVKTNPFPVVLIPAVLAFLKMGCGGAQGHSMSDLVSAIMVLDHPRIESAAQAVASDDSVRCHATYRRGR
jgi:hypothetical protein